MLDATEDETLACRVHPSLQRKDHGMPVKLASTQMEPTE